MDKASLNSTFDQLVIKVIPMENGNGRKLVEVGDLCERRKGRGVDLNRKLYNNAETITRALNLGVDVKMITDPNMLKDVRRYNRQELEEACEDFSNIIGSSPDNMVYKGTMKGGPEIAVISLCIKEESWTGYLELYFQREVAKLAKLDHENTGKLQGYCRERVICFQGCWFLIMPQMGHFTSIYIVISKLLSVHMYIFNQTIQFLQHALLTA